MRLFIALDLDDAFRAQLFNLQSKLRPIIGPASYLKPENFHLTLKFLGDVPKEKVQPLTNALAAIPRVGRFTLHLADLICFPPRGPIRVIAASVNDPSGALNALQAHIDGTAAAEDFPPETRPFNPHITLARAKRVIPGSKRQALNDAFPQSPSIQSTPVREFLLIESILSSTGSVYRPLGRFDINLPQ